MNHHCLCCKHCPDKFDMKFKSYPRTLMGQCKGKNTVMPMKVVFMKNDCEYYTPRPEPQFSQCVAVLRMLGVEVGE